MYSITSLSKPSIEFVNRVTASGGSRSGLFAIAAAFTLARRLPLPSSEVKDCTAHFRAQCEIETLRTLSDLNELLPFSTKEARELVLSFYKFRYASANPIMIPLAFHQDSALEDFFGLSTQFSNEVLGRIKEAPALLTQYVNGLSSILDELNAAKQARLATELAAQQNKDQYVAA